VLTLRTRLNLITFIAISAMGWCAYTTAASGQEYLELQKQVEESVDLRASAVWVQAAPYDSATLKRMQARRAQIREEARQGQFSDILQAYSSRDDEKSDGASSQNP
jgi:hypothetical protein